jgi:nucleotide-binding universal stress UspA family protein
MTILVPTDFSKPSKVAALYAAQLAKKAGAELVMAKPLLVP